MTNLFAGVFYSLVAAASWGFSAFLIRKGASEVSPFRALTTRAITAAPFLFIVAWFVSTSYVEDFQIFFQGDILFLIIFGAMMAGLGDLLFIIALRLIQVSVAQPVSSIYPLITAILVFFAGIEDISSGTIFGAIFIIVGIGAISQQQNNGEGKLDVKNKNLKLGISLSVIAAGLWGTSVFIIDLIFFKINTDVNIPALNAMRMVVIAILAETLLVFRTRTQNLPETPVAKSSREPLFYLAISGLIGWGIGATVFFTAVNEIGAAIATPISSTNPLFGTAFGVIFLKEKISKILGLGIALVIIGVIIIAMV